MVKKSGLKCPDCGAELLIHENDKIVFCQICRKQVKPKMEGKANYLMS